MIFPQEKDVFNISNESDFIDLSKEIFRFQLDHNPIFRNYVSEVGGNPEPQDLGEFTFIPIELFKSQIIQSGDFVPDITFTSSSTTGMGISQHHIKDLNLYETSFNVAFEQFFGPIKELQILALLPAYLERQGSSLVYMADQMIKTSKYDTSGFFLDDLDRLSRVLKKSEQDQIPTLLLGVTFGLLDFAERYPQGLNHTLVMETGGMKGRREELTRTEVHEILKSAFKLEKIHSEYGMTELLSQAYSLGDGIFETPPWMRALVRDSSDPLSIIGSGKTGGLNIIDLANIYSCSFIATQDLGKLLPNNKFEILGRFDNSDIRGCNLMAL